MIDKFAQAGASPLYLRTAFEIARNWQSFHEAGRGRHVLADATESVIAQFIDELSSVQHHEPELVTRTLGYLAAAKNGLSAKELTDVLSQDAGVMRAISSERHGALTDKLPLSVWVRLNRDLSPFLVQKQIDEQPLLQFFHRQFAEVAHGQHYEPSQMALHDALADYFDRGAGPAEKHLSGKKDYAKRSLSELPYQLFHSQRRSRVDQILMTPDWMQQKLNAFGPLTLVADYDRYAAGKMQRFIGRTLRMTAGICSRDQRQLLPQLLGRLMTCSDPAAPAFVNRARTLIEPPALVSEHPSLTLPGAEMLRLEGHSGAVTALAVLPDGRLASASSDHTIRLWDLDIGAETARLHGHTGGVMSLTVVPDGRIASGSSDTTVRVWDLGRYAETARLEGHTEEVTVLVNSDARRSQR
jgi:hypothetical protein